MFYMEWLYMNYYSQRDWITIIRIIRFLVPAKIKTFNWYICKIYVEESTDQRIPEAVIFYLTRWFHKNKHVCKV
ncbi:hypothetical protein HanXRQr2_Chr17g0815371 [Helianthus annuus]|uniref:Uncharacterized protein n=1 Tax=Helianthus annuus TaxID=4232 RepID=A0A251RT55_HELAN|nr:hypothetical protein HanXRQr2_Chr17g0815371 [Helianthus annuus]KAJ0814220.1 hypothetical protein HanPSC8_Chr17g0783051 [Helianthus annuus]